MNSEHTQNESFGQFSIHSNNQLFTLTDNNFFFSFSQSTIKTQKSKEEQKKKGFASYLALFSLCFLLQKRILQYLISIILYFRLILVFNQYIEYIDFFNFTRKNKKKKRKINIDNDEAPTNLRQIEKKGGHKSTNCT